MEKTNTLVSVCSLCYNQKEWICKCIEGILSQKTSFPYEIIIHDDCSTDGTREIVKEYQARYPYKIKLILPNENQYSKGIDMFSKCVEQARGKYIAWCEGDDLWTDENKLQRQVDYLELHPQCSLVYTNTDIFIEKENRIETNALSSGFIKPPKTFKEHLKYAGHLAPLTWMFRKDCFVFNSKRYTDWSYSIALDLFAHGEVHFLNKSTALYRIFNQSISHSQTITDLLRFGKGLIEIKEIYYKRYSNLLSPIEFKKIRNYTYIKYLPAAIAINDENYIKKATESCLETDNYLWKTIITLRHILGLKYIFIWMYKRRGRTVK